MKTILQPITIFAAFLSVAIIAWSVKAALHSVRARLFVILMTAVTVYCFGYSQELIQTTYSGLLYWIRIEYIGIVTIPVLIMLIGIHWMLYKEHEHIHPFFYLFLAPPLFFMLSQWMYPHFNGFYVSVTALFSRSYNVITIVHGPLYYSNTVYSVLCLVVSLFIFSVIAARSRPEMKRKLYMMIAGTMIPGVTYVMYMFSIFPDGIDPIPIAMTIAGPIFAIGIFTQNLINDLHIAKGKYYEDSPSPVFIFDQDQTLIDLNEAAHSLFLCKKNELIHCRWEDLLHLVKNGSLVTLDGDVHFKKLYAYKNREFFPETVLYTDALGTCRGTLRILNDITEIRKAMQILEQEARIDGLTKVLTKKAWEASVENHIQQATRFMHPGSLLMIDLDKFKKVNDTYGHQAGDSVLREISARIKHSVRDIDILGRFGGEELSLWLTETPPDGAKIVAERIRKEIEKTPVLFEKNPIFVTASIGYSGCSEV